MARYRRIVIDDNPAGYWRFEDPQIGNRAYDEMGDHHAVMYGTWVFGAPPAIAEGGRSLWVDNGHTEVPNAAVFNGDRFSAEVWMRPDLAVPLPGGQIIRRVIGKGWSGTPQGFKVMVSRTGHFSVEVGPVARNLDVWLAGADGAINLVRNPSFEHDPQLGPQLLTNPLTGASVTGWAIWAGGTLQGLPTGGPDGSGYTRFTVTAPSGGSVAIYTHPTNANPPVQAGQSYRYSAYVRSADAAQMRMALEWLDNTGAILTGGVTDDYRSYLTGEWTEYEVHAIPPPNATHVRCQFWFSGAQAGERYDVTQVRLSTASLRGWQSYFYNCPGRRFHAVEQELPGGSGRMACRMTSRPSTDLNAYVSLLTPNPIAQRLPVLAGQTYLVRAAVTFTEANQCNRFTFYVNWYDAAGNYLRDLWVNSMGSSSPPGPALRGSYTLAERLTAPPDAASCNLIQTARNDRVGEIADWITDAFMMTPIIAGTQEPFYTDGDQPGMMWTGTPGNSMSAGQTKWQHVVLTYDSERYILYLDGVPVAAGEATGYEPSTTALRIGAQGVNQYPLTGAFDEGAFYPHVLSAEQVARHYEAGLEVPERLRFDHPWDMASWAVIRGEHVNWREVRDTHTWESLREEHGTMVLPTAFRRQWYSADINVLGGSPPYDIELLAPGGVQNFVRNPSFEHDAVGTLIANAKGVWVIQFADCTAVTQHVQDTWSASGRKSIRMTSAPATVANAYVFLNINVAGRFPATPGHRYFFRAAIRFWPANTTRNLNFFIRWVNAQSVILSDSHLVSTTETPGPLQGDYVLSGTAVAPAGAVQGLPCMNNRLVAVGRVADWSVDAVMVVPVLWPGDSPAYRDGDTPGSRWSGAPGDSTTVVAGAGLPPELELDAGAVQGLPV